MATAQVGSGEVGLVQRFAVEPHLVGCSVEMPPEGERKVEVVAEIDHPREECAAELVGGALVRLFFVRRC
ncbi:MULTISPECIES: hypothetical protein [unclassified Streptomyces]|uniref:hypothetical protein n=1 Tax=unclassified Streptomyces TaxID=2593676 RepID=UPI003658CEB1